MNRTKNKYFLNPLTSRCLNFWIWDFLDWLFSAKFDNRRSALAISRQSRNFHGHLPNRLCLLSDRSADRFHANFCHVKLHLRTGAASAYRPAEKYFRIFCRNHADTLWAGWKCKNYNREFSELACFKFCISVVSFFRFSEKDFERISVIGLVVVFSFMEINAAYERVNYFFYLKEPTVFCLSSNTLTVRGK